MPLAAPVTRTTRSWGGLADVLPPPIAASGARGLNLSKAPFPVDDSCQRPILAERPAGGAAISPPAKSLDTPSGTLNVGRLARPKRFELLTPRFVVWCSIQLSYGRVLPSNG